MNLSKIRKQIIKKVFDYSYRKESGAAKYLKIILNNDKIYRCEDVELNMNNIELNNGETILNYVDIKEVVIL